MQEEDPVDPRGGGMFANPAAVIAFVRECLRHLEEPEWRGRVESRDERRLLERRPCRARLIALLRQPLRAHGVADLGRSSGSERVNFPGADIAQEPLTRWMTSSRSPQPHRLVVADEREHATALPRRVALETAQQIHRAPRVGAPVEDVAGLNENRIPGHPAVAAVDDLRRPQDAHEPVVGAVNIANGHDPRNAVDCARIRGWRRRCAQRRNRQEKKTSDSLHGLPYILSRMRLLAAVLIASTILAAQETAPAAVPWLEAADTIAEYIRTASIQKLEDIPVGVTRPQRALFPPGGPIGSVVVKDLRPGRRGGYWESYQSEIAAYEVDRLLGLNMVPPTVERRVNGNLMSAQMFVENCVWLKTLRGQQPPNVDEWNRQVHRQRVFDNLIANIDRNEGNLLVLRSPQWHLVLVDHSRCFTGAKKLPFEMTRIDRQLFERLKALDAATLEARIGKLTVDGVKPLLQRRDAIVRHFEQLAVTKGDAQVFLP